ncbi:MAG: transglutaminase domain-containing protein [Deltaproteobacteria bacterium]|nr:transglutaminase domain-containing protein [Deltaproteobacteria bacterium]
MARSRAAASASVAVRLVMGGLAGLASAAAFADVISGSQRAISFEYVTRVGPIEAGAGPVHVYVPLARESDQQKVVFESIRASIPGSVEIEERYGNRFWHGTVATSDGSAIEIEVETQVIRRFDSRATDLQAGEPTPAELEKFLGANERVVVGDELLDPILAEVRRLAASSEPALLARATYDWVVDNVEYKKTGSGWGNGDSHWACTERYGGCTDFHALFISLARTQGIPARFDIGFPIPEERSAGDIGGYHCWVEFYLPETGWFPVDASEAFKHPEKRELFYGSHPSDRIHFTTGRDLRLGRNHVGRPLNYFIYPYAEVAGEAFEGEIEKSFSFRAAPAPLAVIR